MDWSWTYLYPGYIPWIIFGAFIIAFGFGWLFKDPHEEAILVPNIITVIGLVLILPCLLVIPVDVFNVSHIQTPRLFSIVVVIIYYVSFVILLIFAFLILPFAYFYYVESDDTWQVKIWRALLLTVGTSLGLVAIVVCSFVFRNGEVPFGPDDIWWLPYVIRASDRFLGSRVFAFMFGCLMFVGLIAWVIFTAAGLAIMPISFLKPRKGEINSEDEVEENEQQLIDLQEQLRSLASKYELRGKKMGRKAKQEMEEIKAQIELLKRKTEKSKATHVNLGWFQTYATPAKMIFGLILGLIALFVITCIILTTLDRTLHSPCGYKCGFLLTTPQIFNPLDQLLTYASILFPLDYLVFLFLIALLVSGTITGLAAIGCKRFPLIKLFKLRIRSTVPQGLLMACLILMFTIVVISHSMVSIAPQYATFGSQRYLTLEGDWAICNYEALNKTENSTDPESFHGYLLQEKNETGGNTTRDSCFMTELATLVNTANIRVPFFSIVSYGSNWLFVASFFISAFIAMLFAKPLSYFSEAYERDKGKERTPLLDGSSQGGMQEVDF